METTEKCQSALRFHKGTEANQKQEQTGAQVRVKQKMQKGIIFPFSILTKASVGMPSKQKREKGDLSVLLQNCC